MEKVKERDREKKGQKGKGVELGERRKEWAPPNKNLPLHHW